LTWDDLAARTWALHLRKWRAIGDNVYASNNPRPRCNEGHDLWNARGCDDDVFQEGTVGSPRAGTSEPQSSSPGARNGSLHCNGLPNPLLSGMWRWEISIHEGNDWNSGARGHPTSPTCGHFKFLHLMSR
jgi:hypothetical protein